MASKKTSRWLKEWLTPHESHSHGVRKVILQKKTSFQSAMVADSYSFGRCLILDGEMQSSEHDEFIYHESLVHPALTCHPAPKTVLILGGGEGATVREILKHKTVEFITMVDIDGEVIEFCKEHLVSWHQGSFEDPRLRLIVDDAKAFVEGTDEKFDVIISDLPSPIEAGPAFQLYTIEFYRELRKRLRKNGVFVMQAGSGSVLQIELHQVLYSTLRRIFDIVRPFYSYVPSYDVPWAFLIGSDTQDPLGVTEGRADAVLRQRRVRNLKFYDGATHVGLFHIPKHIRTLLAREDRVVTKDKPIYFFK